MALDLLFPCASLKTHTLKRLVTFSISSHRRATSLISSRTFLPFAVLAVFIRVTHILTILPIKRAAKRIALDMIHAVAQLVLASTAV